MEVKTLGLRLGLISQRLLVVRVARPTLTNRLHISVILIRTGITIKGKTLPQRLAWKGSSGAMVSLAYGMIVVIGVLRGIITNAHVAILTTRGMRNLHSESTLMHQQGVNVEG